MANDIYLPENLDYQDMYEEEDYPDECYDEQGNLDPELVRVYEQMLRDEADAIRIFYNNTYGDSNDQEG